MTFSIKIKEVFLKASDNFSRLFSGDIVLLKPALKISFVFLGAIIIAPSSAPAQDKKMSAAGEMARKLQDPLASIAAIMTENNIMLNHNTGRGTGYSFQFQPVKAFDFPEQGFTFIPRGIIPLLGAPTTACGKAETIWGMGDILTQFFVVPKLKSDWKIGGGPQFSWKTRTDSRLGGPGWGAGPAGVLVGNLTEEISLALLGTHLWAYDGSFSITTFQPMLFYNFPDIPGAYVGYGGTILYDWKADSGNHWTVPIGVSVGKTFDMGDGYGLDGSIGPYWNAANPDGVSEWTIKFSVNLLFP